VNKIFARASGSFKFKASALFSLLPTAGVIILPGNPCSAASCPYYLNLRPTRPKTHFVRVHDGQLT